MHSNCNLKFGNIHIVDGGTPGKSITTTKVYVCVWVCALKLYNLLSGMCMSYAIYGGNMQTLFVAYDYILNRSKYEHYVRVGT